MIDTINTIDRINCINQYKDNQYDQFTLKTSPTQLQQCCSLFRCDWLVKVRSIVVLHLVLSCWHTHLCFLFCFCLPLNPTVETTSEVILLSQGGIYYFNVSHGQLFLPGFLLLTEPSSCVSGDINHNKEYLTIMSSITQDDDHKSSDVLL